MRRRSALVAAAAVLAAIVLAAVALRAGRGERRPDPLHGPGEAGSGAIAPGAPGAPLASASAAASPTVPVSAGSTGGSAETAAPQVEEIPARQTIRSPRVAAASVGWDEVPIAARTGELGEVAAPVRAALLAARDRMDPCFEEEARILARRPPPPAVDDPPTGPGVLVLHLESRPGALDVVDARLESLGTSTPELAECARQVLKGWPITANGAAPGRRYRVKFVLQ